MKSLFTTGALVAAFALTSAASAAVLFQEDFTSSANANFVERTAGQTATAYIDYSNFTYGGNDFALPANPYGTGTSNGLLVQVNRDEGEIATYSMFAANAQGNAMQLSGNYIVSYDVYMNYELGQGDTTEFIGAVFGKDGSAAFGRRQDTISSTFTFFSNDGDNGDYDYRLLSYNDANTAVVHEIVNPEDDAAKAAFGEDGLIGNGWASFKIVVNEGTTTVFVNGEEFISTATDYTDGAVGLFYEDYYGGSTAAGHTDKQWAVFDSFKVTDIPEPASLALFGLGGLAMLRRRK